MERKHLQQTYKTDEAELQRALDRLDAVKDDDAGDALADLPELPDLPEDGEEHVAHIYPKK